MRAPLNRSASPSQASFTRGVQVYLHARRERDREIASSLGKMAKRELKKSKKRRKGKGSGT